MTVGEDLVDRSATLVVPSSSLSETPMRTATKAAAAAATTTTMPPVSSLKHNHSNNNSSSNKIDISSEYHEIEIRILTKWINKKLSQVGDSIQNISKDLQDGTRLLKLLSVLTNNETLLKPERGNMRIHKLSNVSQVLTYLKEQWGQENLPAIGSEAIVNGDLKSTMALTYFIMLKYQLLPLFQTDSTPQPPPSPLPTQSSQSAKGSSDNAIQNNSNSNITMMMEAKAILLFWVQSQLRDYVGHHILATIHDFARSWTSGLAFCLLIHSYDPFLMPISFKELIQLAANKENANKLLSMAFDIAAEKLNVSKYLEPIDLAFPHEPSIMIYVSELYKHMSLQATSSSEEKQQQEDDILLVRRRRKLSDINTVAILQNGNSNSMNMPIIPTPQPSLSTTMYPIIPKAKDNIPVHPLDATIQMAQEVERSLSQLPIPSDMMELEKFNQMQAQCELFKRGATVAQLIDALQQELNIIQQLMNESGTTSVTNDTIRDLENRIHIVSTSIQGVHEEYDADFDNDDVYIHRIDALEETYEKVRDWVDEVRSWFVEAERIRKWIDEHIETIQKRNSALADQCGDSPLSREVTLTDDAIRQLHHEHARLKHEIERFDSDDMDRLRAHVKKLTTAHHNEEFVDGNVKKDEDLTPADTSTIEITLTTLNQLNRLTKLLEKRSHTIDLLLLRSQWEDLFGNAVQWIASTDAELDHFLNTKARWSAEEQEEHQVDDDCKYKVEEVIKTLVNLEHKIADFDQTSYSDVLDAYQEMEALKSSDGSMPDYLEARQVGFERAFEDLMKRSSYSRKVVEQYLYMVDAVKKFKDLRESGEQLRQRLSQEEDVSGDMNEENDGYAEEVQMFKENSARLITNVNSGITYPSAPSMSTAIGAHDAREGEITHENIRSTISTYSMTLALLADSLDQLLTSRYQMMSLQQRASDALSMLNKCKSWIDERIRLLRRAPFETMLYSESMPDSSTSSSIDSVSAGGLVTSRENYTSAMSNTGKLQHSPDSYNTTTTAATAAIIDEEHFSIFEKERDMIALRFQQLESEELGNILQTVHQIEFDVDAANAVSVDRSALINQMEGLQGGSNVLKELLATRGHQLDALKRRIEWETQWSKSNSHIQTLVRKFCDFILKKVSFTGLSDVAGLTYQGDQELMQSLRFLQERLGELEERFLVPLADIYSQLTDSYVHGLSSELPDFMTDKQANLKFKYEDLKHLASYTTDMVKQRNMLTEFVLRVQDIQNEGEKIKEWMMKKTRRMRMLHGQQQQYQPQMRSLTEEDEDTSATANRIEARIEKFKLEIKNICEDCCGKSMIYPTYNGQWFKIYYQQYPQRQQQQSPNDSASRTVKSILDKRQKELKELEKKIDECLKEYQNVEHQNSVVNQYIQETHGLNQWINQALEQLRSQYNVDVSAETFMSEEELTRLKQMYQSELLVKVERFEREKVKALHEKVSQLITEAVDIKRRSTRNSDISDRSVDVSMAAQKMAEVMDHLSDLKAGLSEHAYAFEVAMKRLEWESNLQQGITFVEAMNEQLRQLTHQRNSIFNQEELHAEELSSFEQGLNRLVSSRDHFQDTLLPAIQFSYDQFVECFPRLPKPIAIPDHLEARMETLSKTAARVQEGVDQRGKELDLMEQRVDLEAAVEKALLFFASVITDIEVFIEQKARWQISTQQTEIADNVDDHDQEAILRTEWSNKYNAIENYKQESVIPMKEKFDQLTRHNSTFYDNNSIFILPTSSVRKFQAIDSAVERTEYYLEFSNEILTQRCLLSAFVLRTAQLEKSAELIREEFIESNKSSNNRNTLLVDLLESHSNRLKNFKSGIDDVRNNLAKSIPLPVRALKDVSTQTKIKDESTNTVIQEMISMRIAKLDELWISLQQLLESKERITRRRLSLYTFKKQAEIVEAWIQSRQKALLEIGNLDNKEEQVVLEHLRDVVARVEGIQQAMKAKENVLTEFQSAFEKCIAAENDESLNNEEGTDNAEQQPFNYAQQMSDIVYPTQQRLSNAWNDLFAKVLEVGKSRKALLIECKVVNWQKAVRNTLQSVTENEQLLVNDNNTLAEGLETFHRLETTELTELKTEVEVNKGLFSTDQMNRVQQLLEDGSSLIEELRIALASAQRRLNLNQLIESHANALEELQQLLHKQKGILMSLEESFSQQVRSILAVAPNNGRQNLYQTLLTSFKETLNNTSALEVQYFSVVEQYNRILQIDGSFKSDKQEHLQQSWNELEQQDVRLTNLLSQAAKWMNLFDILHSARAEMHQIECELKSEDVQQKLPSCTDELSLIEKKITQTTSDIPGDLRADIKNYATFEAERSECFNSLANLKLQVDAIKAQKEVEQLLKELTDKIQQLMQTYNTTLRQTLDREGDIEVKELTTKEEVNALRSYYDDSLRVMQSLQQKLQMENELLENNMITLLLTKYNHSREDLELTLQPLSGTTRALNQTIDAYKTAIANLELIGKHIKIYTDICGMIDNCDNLLAKSSIEQHLVDAESQSEIIEQSINELTQIGQYIKANESFYAHSTVPAIHNACSPSQHREKDVKERYMSLKDTLSDLKAGMQTEAARTQLIVKLRDTLQFISNSKERLSAYDLDDRAAFDEVQEFDVVCNDFLQSYNKKQKIIDELTDAVFGKTAREVDSEISQLQSEVVTAFDDINSLINMKMKVATAKGDLSDYLAIMEEFDQKIASLATAIEQASPHHSKVINNKFVKSDLQLLLKQLVASFREHQLLITSILERARVESKKHFFLDDSHRVSEGLQKARKRWAQTKSLAASREKELQTCINQLDHEFFTKLAIAKSSTAAGKVAFTKRAGTIKECSNGRHNEMAARVMMRKSSKSPPYQQQSSSSSSVTTSTTKVNQDYVPDPENELDIQLSHIVNDSKYRIRVKHVPNQVGKYWFGDVNPKLVYCRILPSQMVMVRVGGGWVELTNFLKDHNLIEGSLARSEFAADQTAHTEKGSVSPFQETYLHTLRASSPSGRISIRGGGSVNKASSSLPSVKLSRSAENRAKSPGPGFVHGDKFISVDKEGNRIVVNMKRAGNDAKTPVIIRKKKE